MRILKRCIRRSEMRRAVDGRYPCGEGGWIHLRIEEERAVQDALLLAERRIHPVKKK